MRPYIDCGTEHMLARMKERSGGAHHHPRAGEGLLERAPIGHIGNSDFRRSAARS
jgi:hypothetical protein